MNQSRITDVVDVDEFLECQPWNGITERNKTFLGTEAANGHANPRTDDGMDIVIPPDDEDIVIPSHDALEMQPLVDQGGTR
jgi:hypothetical protein